MAERETAKQALKEYAGLSYRDAAALVGHVVASAEREALELLAGDAPLPGSIADSRALRLRYIVEAAGRALRPIEVEVTFRVPPSTAQSIIRRLNATYPRAVDAFLKDAVRRTATVTPTGSAEAGLRYAIYFDEPSALDAANQLLQRRGLTRDVKVRRPEQTLDVPRDIGGTNPLDVLGIPKPRK